MTKASSSSPASAGGSSDGEPPDDLLLRIPSGSDEAWRQLAAEFAPQKMWTADAAGDVDYCNRRWIDYTGLTLEQSLGAGWAAALEPSECEECVERWRRAVQTGVDYETECRFKRGSDGAYRWHLVRATPLRDSHGQIVKWISVAVDIDEQKQAEQMLHFLVEAGMRLAGSLDYQTTLQSVARLAVPRIADWCAVDIVEADGSLNRLAVEHVDPAKVELAKEIQRRYPIDMNAPRGVPHVLRTGQPEFVEAIPDEMVAAAARDPEHLQILRDVGLRSYMIVPLSARGRMIGAISFVAAESGRRYNLSSVALAEELARRAALAVDNARLYAAEQQARQVAEQAANRTLRLQAVTAALSESLTLEQVAQVVIDHGKAVLGAEAAFIMLLSPDDGQLELISAVGFEHTNLNGWSRFPMTADVPLAEAVRTRQPIWFGTTAERIAQYPHLAAQYGPQDSAWISLPLIVEGRAVGGMSLRFDQARVLSSEDRSFILSLSQQCAQAFERARLYEAERQARAEAEAVQQRLAFLAEASSVLSSSLDYETTLTNVAHLAVPQLADWCVIHIKEADGSLRRLAATHADPAKVSLLAEIDRRYPSDPNSLYGVRKVLRTGAPELLSDISDAVLATIAQDDDHLSLLRALNLRAQICLPLQARGRILGTLSLAVAESGRRYSAADIDLAEDLARRAALAVDHARLYRDAREAERAKEESLALLDTLLASAPVGFAFWDRDLRYQRLNQALAAINGLPLEQHIGRTIHEIVPDVAAEISARFERVLQYGESVVDIEISGKTPAAPGEQRYWLVSYYPVRQANGEILGIGGVVNEITERKQAEANLQFLAEASRLLVSSLDYHATLSGLARLAVMHLADVCTVDMLEEHDAIQRVAVAHADPRQDAMIRERMQNAPLPRSEHHPVIRALQTGQAQLISDFSDHYLASIAQEPEHLEILRKAGFVSAIFAPLITRGRVLGVISFMTTHPDRRYSSADLRLAEDLARRAAFAVDNARLYRDAQEAIQARDEFLSIASHELKTPVTSLQLQSQTLLRAASKGALDKMTIARLLSKLELIDQQAQRLARLANDLLDVTRIRSSKVDIRLEEADLAAIVQDVAARFDEQFEQAGCALRLETPMPIVALWDRSRIEQIVTNLLSNAVKYGAGKPIDVSVTSDQTTARLVVRDYGIGIAPEHLERIFIRFERAVSAQNYGGLGLGLYIVRQLVEALSGTIQVTSELGQGATFTVSLPCTR